MKIAVCADVHIGNHKRFGGITVAGINQRCAEALRVLDIAYAEAFDRGCKTMVVCGDLFDSVRPEPQIIAATQKIISEWTEQRLRTIVLRGNHEAVSDNPLDDSIGPLSSVCSVVRVEPFFNNASGFELCGSFLYLPYQRSVPIARHLENVEADMSGFDGVSGIFGHFGIYDDNSPEYLKAPSSIHIDRLFEIVSPHLENSAEGKAFPVLAGDFHKSRIWTRSGPKKGQMIQAVCCGALCPTGFADANYGDYGILWVIEPGEGIVDTANIPGPRFFSYDMTSESLRMPDVLDELHQMLLRRCNPCVRIVSKASELEMVRASIKDFCREKGVEIRYEIMVDESEVKERAREAAAATRSSDSLAAGLSEYVDRIQIPEGVDREVVLEKCGQFLGV